MRIKKAALDKDLADAFAAASAKVADSQLDRKARLAARKDALRHLHRLMGVITGFAPLDAFVRGNPFDSGGAGSKLVGSLRQMLPRLEVKILTSIKE